MQRRLIRQAGDARLACGIGHQAQVAGRAPGIGIRDEVERRQRQVRRHPADALAQVVLDFGGGEAAAAGDAGDIRRDEGRKFRQAGERLVVHAVPL